jgi:pimeloyl-ACP methyl ester carboxylesterase
MTPTHTFAEERLIDTPNGRVFVREMQGEDPAIVMMHGFPDDHRIYDRLLPLLSPRRGVAFDFVGYGRSDRTDAAGFSTEEHASILTALLDELDIARAVVVGTDASGPDAIMYSIANPDRVARLVLLNTMFGRRPSLRMPEMTRLFSDPELTSLVDDMVGDPNQLLWLLQRWGTQLGVGDDLEGSVRRSILAQFFGDADQPDAIAAMRAWTAILHQSLDEQEAVVVRKQILAHLGVPTSIIFGKNDRYLNPSLASEMAALFANPLFHLVPDAGHYVQYDQPEAVAQLLTRDDET